MEEEQILIINLDDSGKLVASEDFLVYAGVIFYSNEEYNKFINGYKEIVTKRKVKYCKENCDTSCSKKCPELKSYNLKSYHRREFVNYIKKYETMACIIQNKNLYDYVVKDEASRRRYTDYAIRRTIKEMVIKLIQTKKLNPYKPLNIMLNIDQQTTKSNGYYLLENGIHEELIHGIINFNYSIKYPPVLFSTLKIKVRYLSSHNNYHIQASDIIAGTVRRTLKYYKNDIFEALKRLNYINYYLLLP